MQNQSPVRGVPMLDIQAQTRPIENEINEAVAKVLREKKFILGPEVAELESRIADYVGAAAGVGVSSGTDALVIALMALDIGPGDEVITTPFTFFATAGSIARVGATPVFVDIDPQTYNIDPTKIESKITKNTKVIIPVHLFGQMADMDAIMAIAKAHGLRVIEDAAQAIGASMLDKDGETRKAGSIGDIGCFSFFPSKNLGGCGDGGMVVTQDEELAQKLRILRVHGSAPKYYHQIIGGNFRLDTIQAAILLVKLNYLDSQHQGRQNHAAFYDSHIHTPKTPYVMPRYRSIYNQYTIRTPNRDALKAILDDKKIGSAIYYPVPLHQQTCFSYLGTESLPESEKAAQDVLSIPIYAELTQAQLAYIVESIQVFSDQMIRQNIPA